MANRKKKYPVSPPTAAEKKAFLDALRKGLTYKLASAKAKNHESITRRWRINDPEFAKEVSLARDEGVSALVQELLACPKNWQAIGWYLERSEPGQFGRQDRYTAQDMREQAERFIDRVTTLVPVSMRAELRAALLKIQGK